MIYYKTEEEIEKLRVSNLLVSKTLALVASIIKPGVTGAYIDKKAEELILDNGAIPGFKGYNDFPATLCISVNDAVVHGIPTNIEFKSGDIVSVDCGSIVDGYYGDSAFTFALGDVDERTMNLLRITNEALYKGIDAAIVGNRIGDIGSAIQNYCEKEHGFGVVRELVGHGVGKSLHEDPQVPNYGKSGRGIKLQDGLVIAIEPMVNLGKKNVMQSKDGWTVITKDSLPSAHYEHTIAVRNGGVDILSNHDEINLEVKNNANLKEVS